ncbi:uncharacterized protein LOC111078246 [Drosophila obscura]|uniref:uncharacterized protein LOC111078246 n=1 Tax=Drosophila obscura TaxID=7282 RepID=UPI001BB14BF1|nr:uncharacterized protein LOC111078246 [Drosophila obscura]
MCTNLVDLFACIKPQTETETEPETMPAETLDGLGNSHRRSMLVDDMAAYDLAEQLHQEMLREKEKEQQRLSLGSRSKRQLRAPRPNLPPAKHLPAPTCIRPLAREKRNSFETLERYELVFSVPIGSEHCLPDQF